MKYYNLLLLLLLVPSICWSQESSKEDLRDILLSLQERHKIQFSFTDEAISDKMAIVDSTLTLEQTIAKLELDTRLRFQFLNDDYIVVRNYRGDDLVTICGNIKSHSGSPLLGVSIGFSSSEGVFTDENGRFKLDSIPYESWLTLSYLGFATKRLKVSRLSFKECVQIKMSESIEELDEIVVSDYLAAGISKNYNEIQINPHTLKTLSGLAEPDILQSIQQIPGVNSPFETAAGIHVRGGLPDQNLVLWNGIKTYNHSHFFGMISAFNPYITDKVSFIKHGTSAKYGDRISSVIDINSSQRVAKNISGGIGTNLLFSDGFVEIPLLKDKLSIEVSARRSFTDILQTPTYNQISDRVFQNTKIGDETSGDSQSKNSFYFTDFSFSSSYELNNNNTFILSGLYNKNELQFQSQDALGIETFSDELLNENEGVNIKWIGKLNDRFGLEASGSLSRYILRYEFIRSVPDTTTLSSKKNFVKESNYQLNGDYNLSDGHSLAFGYNYSNSKIRYAYETEAPSYEIVLDSDNSIVDTHSGFIEYLFDNKSLLIRPGIRLNYYQQLNESFVEPRLYIQKQLASHFALSLSTEYRTQIASQIKESVVSDLSLENKVWALASSDKFPVIKSLQFSSGLSFSKDGWFTELEAYRKSLNGVTTLIFGYLNGLENQFREGESQIHGADLLLKKIWPQYESWVSYSYIKTENSFDDVNENRSFPGSWSIEHTIRWSNIYNLDDWEFSLGWIWHTGKSFTDVINTSTEGPVQIFYDEINQNNLPVYHRLDMSVMKEFNSKKNNFLRYRIGLSILNLYNKKNLLNREFRTTPSLNNQLIDTRVYSLGFTPNLVFRVFWD
ncbi:TonB-dependent receptor [Ekhidna sp.]